MKMVKKFGLLLISISLLIIAWQGIIYIGQYEEALLPSPFSVSKAIMRMINDGTLFIHLKDSMFRFTIGYGLAVIPAIILGMILARTTLVLAIIDPIIQVLRPVSPVAWSPFIVLWFGIGNIPAIAIIFIAAFFPVLMTTLKGVKNIDDDYLKIAQNLEVKGVELLWKFIFPATFPQIVTGLRIALGTAWIFLVAGEMVGAQSGLGFLIIDARNTLNLDYVLAGIIFIGVSGYILDRFIGALEKWVGSHWGLTEKI